MTVYERIEARVKEAYKEIDKRAEAPDQYDHCDVNRHGDYLGGLTHINLDASKKKQGED